MNMSNSNQEQLGGEWNCTCCTFTNQIKHNRCQMCHAHRPRITRTSIKQRMNKQSTMSSHVIDLTSGTRTSTGSNSDNDSGRRGEFNENSNTSTDVEMPRIASTDSARKKRRKRKLMSTSSDSPMAAMSESKSSRSRSRSRSRSSSSYNENDENDVEIINVDDHDHDYYSNNKNGRTKIKSGNRKTTSNSSRSRSSSMERRKRVEKENDSCNRNKNNSGTSTRNSIINNASNAIAPSTRKSKYDLNNNNENKSKQVHGSSLSSTSSSSNNQVKTLFRNDRKSNDVEKGISKEITNSISENKNPYSLSSTYSSSSKVQRTLFGKAVQNEPLDEKKLKKRSQFPPKAAIEIISSSSQRTATTTTSSASAPTAIPRKSKNRNTMNQIIHKPMVLTYDQLYKKAIHNLQTIFKIQSLRNLQPKAIESALQSKSQIIIMATGGGKSLCYQLPATVLGGVTIVISPLIALMVDQVRNLREKGIEAVDVSSMVGAKEKNLIMKRLRGENIISDTNKKKSSASQQQQQQQQKPIKLVYCTPELVKTDRFRGVLMSLYERNQLSLIAIDEAHCLSTWGHDFRPSYRQLSWLRTSFPDVPFMACTATATKKVVKDIREVLCMNNGEECHMSTFNRPNIDYEIRYKDAMGETSALEDLVKVVQKEHIEAAKINAQCSGIVYVHKRDDTTLIASEISKTGITAAPYHGGLKDKERKEMQQQWTDGRIKVAVATVAFGMGIDLAHVRYVLHWSLAKSVEGFYQESGRAGRDGLKSKSILYYSSKDANTFQYLISKNAAKKANDGKHNAHAVNVDEISMDALRKMIEFCTQPCCRRQYLLRHFGEEIDPKAVCQKTCDYCLDPSKMERAMNKTMVTRAKRDVRRQQQQFRSAKKWEGRQGDSSDESSAGGFDNDAGLGITHYDKSFDPKLFPNKMGGFKSAKDVLSHYEAMECKGQKNGFVTFKKSSKFSKFDDASDEEKNTRRSTTVKIPEHMREKLNKATRAKPVNVPKSKGSKEYRSAAEKLRAELAEIERQQQLL